MWIEFDSVSSSPPSPLAAASRFTLMLSSTAAAFLPLLPLRQPEIVSGGIPSAYHAFVVSIMFAFSCSFSAALLDRQPPAAGILRLAAVAWLSSAVVLFLYLAFFDRSV